MVIWRQVAGGSLTYWMVLADGHQGPMRDTRWPNLGLAKMLDGVQGL